MTGLETDWHRRRTLRPRSLRSCRNLSPSALSLRQANLKGNQDGTWGMVWPSGGGARRSHVRRLAAREHRICKHQGPAWSEAGQAGICPPERPRRAHDGFVFRSYWSSDSYP